MAIEQVITALREGEPVLLPTDTVYGLCNLATSEDAAMRAYRLKGRLESQPTALLAATLESLFEALPELVDSPAGVIARTLLPGGYTLVLPNPARRYRWLNGTRIDTIGVRVPHLPEAAHAAIEAVGAVMATSANEPGGPSPVTLDDVPARIRAGCAAELDAGPLPGTPSTVIDFTGTAPYVIREGAEPSAEALERVRVSLGQ